MEFNLELDKAVEKINSSKAKLVCIQLPDGLKPRAVEISNYLEKQTKAKILIWLDTCFGSCDIPNLKDIDLLIHFGHSKFK